LGLDRTRAGNVQIAGKKEIRARVIGKDITDSSHWVNYLRTDGVLVGTEMRRKWTGTWKIQNNKLCMSMPDLRDPIAMKSGCLALT
jgi:hypothetical protein